MKDLEWEITRMFVNAVLRKGMEKEASNMKKYMNNARKYREFMKHKTKKGFLKELQDGL